MKMTEVMYRISTVYSQWRSHGGFWGLKPPLWQLWCHI